MLKTQKGNHLFGGFAVWFVNYTENPYQDFIGWFGKSRYNPDGVCGYCPLFSGSLILSLHPAMVRRKFIVFNKEDKLCFFETKKSGIIWKRKFKKIGIIAAKKPQLLLYK